MTIGRPCEFDPAAALEAALRVFWQRGYDATSLDDLLAGMGIGRSSFYQAFGSKDKLFRRCLTQYRDWCEAQLRELLATAPSGRAFLEKVFHLVSDCNATPMGRSGCLLMNTATEFGQRDPAIARQVNEALGHFEKLFLEAVTRAQAEGDIPKSADARSLALYLATNLGGLKGMARAGASPEKIRTVVKVIMNSLK